MKRNNKLELKNNSKINNKKSIKMIEGGSKNITKTIVQSYNKSKIINSNQIYTFKDNKYTGIGNKAFNGMNEIKNLDLSNNEITTISNNIFEELPKLKCLNLSSNKINIIKKGAFDGLYSLEELDLSNNKITTINKYTFKDLYNLKSLNLSNNKNIKIEVDAFIGLINLTNIEIDPGVTNSEEFKKLKRKMQANNNNKNKVENTKKIKGEKEAFKVATLVLDTITKAAGPKLNPFNNIAEPDQDIVAAFAYNIAINCNAISKQGIYNYITIQSFDELINDINVYKVNYNDGPIITNTTHEKLLKNYNAVYSEVSKAANKVINAALTSLMNINRNNNNKSKNIKFVKEAIREAINVAYGDYSSNIYNDSIEKYADDSAKKTFNYVAMMIYKIIGNNPEKIFTLNNKLLSIKNKFNDVYKLDLTLIDSVIAAANTAALIAFKKEINVSKSYDMINDNVLTPIHNTKNYSRTHVVNSAIKAYISAAYDSVYYSMIGESVSDYIIGIFLDDSYTFSHFTSDNNIKDIFISEVVNAAVRPQPLSLNNLILQLKIKGTPNENRYPIQLGIPPQTNVSPLRQKILNKKK